MCISFHSPAKDMEESQKREEVFEELRESFAVILGSTDGITTDDAEQTLTAVTSIAEAGAGAVYALESAMRDCGHRDPS